MKRILTVLFLVLILAFLLVGCGGGDGGRGSDNNGSQTPTQTKVPTPTPGALDPVINEFETSSNNVLLGTSIQLTANFQNGTGIITPGNIIITSGVSISLKPTLPTTYVLKVTDKYGSWTSEELTVNVYLAGKYTYKLYGAYPIDAYFSFSSTGSGNFSWKRTFPGFPAGYPDTVDWWGGVFHYTIKGSTIDLYWTDGNRNGTHSTIDSFSSNYVMFEGACYNK